MFVNFFCNILFFRKEFFSVNFLGKKFFLGTLFGNFSFHEKICFKTLILNYLFSKKNNFLEFYAFPEKTFGETNSYG